MTWLRQFHLGERPVTGAGTLSVERGRSMVSRVIGAALRLPRAGTAQALHVRIERCEYGDAWHRVIGGRRLDSRQRRSGDVITERAGLVELRLRLTASDDELTLTPLSAALRLGALRVPLPALLAPHTEATATATGPLSFRIDTRVWIPSAGLLIAYRGDVWAEGASDG
jgi:hypothetical protein